jgi:cytochrome P450
MQTSVLPEGSQPFIPPHPEPAPEDLSPRQLLTLMRTNNLRVWSQRAYEEEVVVRRAFGRSSVIFNAPEAIRHLLVDHPEAYGRSRATLRMLKPLLGEGLFISEGAAWRHQRRTLTPAFTPRSVELLVPHIRSATDEMIGRLAAGERDQVELFPKIQRLALEIAGRTMFSVEMQQQGPLLRDQIIRNGQGLGRPRLLDFVVPIGIPTPHDWARAWFRRGWIRLIDQIMAERLKAKTHASGPRDLLDLLLAARDPEGGEGFSPRQLRDQIATMILAGHETMAVALCWSVYLLAQLPEVQERIAQEAATALADSGAEPEPNQLTYTRAVLDEVMRLYPPAYVIVRAACHPDKVAGVEMKLGDLAFIAPWLLHRHHRRWHEPDAFVPEQFLPGAPAVDRLASLPFGVGPRVCIGAHFALTESTLVLAELIRSFRIELGTTRPVFPVAVVTTQPDHAPPFRLQRRESCRTKRAGVLPDSRLLPQHRRRALSSAEELPTSTGGHSQERAMARSTRSVSRTRTADRGASRKGAGKRAAAQGRSAGRGAVKRGGAKRGATKRQGRRAVSKSKAGRSTLSPGKLFSSRRMPKRRQQRNGDVFPVRERRALRLRGQLQFHHGNERAPGTQWRG